MGFSIVLFDNTTYRNSLLPLVATRPIGDLRVGVLTIREKWELLFLQQDVSCLTIDYLQAKFPLSPSHSTVVAIDATLLPRADLVDLILDLDVNCRLVDESHRLLAVKILKENLSLIHNPSPEFFDTTKSNVSFSRLTYPEDVFSYNAEEIVRDISLLNLTKFDANLLNSTVFIGDEFYMDKSSVLEHVIVDTTQGPVVIGSNVVVEPGVILKGPVAIGEGTRIKAGAVLYPNVTIGPNCTISGELNNVVMWGNSAKGHEGYLGCAVIGEGCNLGAGTTNSNLKNDWSSVKLYDYSVNDFRDTAKLKCGAIIADQVMLGIQSKINTGTVIGVGAQIAISKFIPKFVPDFSWMTDTKTDSYMLPRFELMMHRKSNMKKECLGENDLMILRQVYNNTKELREKINNTN